MTKRHAALAAFALVAAVAFSEDSEIRVDLKLDASDFVSGERIRGVIDVANSSPDEIRVGGKGAPDRLFVEVFKSGDMSRLERQDSKPFTASFDIKTGEGQKLETFLGDRYALRETRRYLAKPVLVHDGIRYEGLPKAFDVVDGVRLATAAQMFANKKGLRRDFEVVYWSRSRTEHAFLKVGDSGTSSRHWETRDLGPILRLDRPSISILGTGEVVVLHRLNQDQFVRNEFWSLPNALDFRLREIVRDPETAGTARVRELYKEGGVKPKVNPWWKFW